MSRHRRHGRLSPLAWVLVGFALVAAVLAINVAGVPLVRTQAGASGLAILSREETSSHVKQAEGDADTLLVFDGSDEASQARADFFSEIMTEMRVSCDTRDLSQQGAADLSGYRRVVVLGLAATEESEEDLEAIRSYVGGGGMLMLASLPEDLSELGPLEGLLGIEGSSRGGEVAVSDFAPREGFMLGGGETYQLEEGSQSAIEVELADTTEVMASDSDGSIPLVWTAGYGEGRSVVCNLQEYDRTWRGVYSSAFSLLGDACVWPVIDASIWWLDDFPSPVPEGDDQYIERDYHMTTAEFFSRVWWPDVLELSSERGFAYSGALIETYDQQTTGDLGGSVSTNSFLYYGNQLLNSGGEIAYHGYNHQPLCGPDYRYAEDLGYVTWEGEDEMSASLDELRDFVEGLYEGAEPVAYVPPSNILSDEGRAVIAERHQDIRAIASTYLPGADSYVQEFTVAGDGEIEMPRIVSGESPDSAMMMAALSELNLHYVNSHSMSPTDVLGGEGNAAEGWEQLKQDLGEYMDWVERSAPDLEEVTASGMAARVQRFANVSPTVSYEGEDVYVKLTGFHDRAWLMLRLNGAGEVASVEGGSVTELGEGLYLLEATSDDVTITRRAA